MDSKIQNIDLLRSFILKLTDSDIYAIEKLSLTSAQKSRIASWCEENNIEIPDLSNESFWKDGVNNNNNNKNLYIETDFENNILIGVDIQCISEFLKDKNSFSKLDEDLFGIFTKRELSYAESKEDPKETLTGIFAAKEAIYKSQRIEIRNWNEIEIKHEKGIPSFKNYSISISHSGNFAIAIAAIGKDSKISKTELIKVSDSSFKAKLRNLIIAVGVFGGILYLFTNFAYYI